jgi:hypothetical protein
VLPLGHAVDARGQPGAALGRVARLSIARFFLLFFVAPNYCSNGA